jgi:hypothetical protein
MGPQDTPMDGYSSGCHSCDKYPLHWHTRRQDNPTNPTSFDYVYGHHRFVFIFISAMVPMAAKQKNQFNLTSPMSKLKKFENDEKKSIGCICTSG